MKLSQEPKCPVCNLRMRNRICEKHGAICKNCGTLYKDSSCPNCFPLNQLQSIRGLTQSNSRIFPLGELVLGSKEFGAITGRQSVSKKELNILRAASDDGSKRKEIRQKAEAAVHWLGIPRNAETELVDTVERNTISLSNRYRINADRDVHISLDNVISYSLLTEAKKIGKTILDVQDALAMAGFKVKLQQFTLRISAPYETDISSVEMYVNGRKRVRDWFRVKETGDGPLGKEYTIIFQVYLSDTIDRKGRIGERDWIKVHFENAVIVSSEPALFGRSDVIEAKWYSIDNTSHEKTRKAKIRSYQEDPGTIWLRLNSGKCFALFKAMNRIFNRSARAPNEVDLTAYETEGSLKRHFSVLSKWLPASAALMKKALCLVKVERRSSELFSELIKNSRGRSHRTLALDALIQADHEIYYSLSEVAKCEMRAFVTSLPLTRKDRSYTAIEGLLIPSEMDRRELSRGGAS